jgi:clusterin-associated protein 1
LLKLVDVLTAALRANIDGGSDDDTEVDISKFDLSHHADALKNTRVLASQITSRGSTLHELLGDEVELRESRADAIARPLDVDEIEAGVTRTIALAREEIERTKALMDNVGADETNLAQKIEIKQAEIDRNNKRLRSLEGYRPPYMDEYEKYESDLKEQVRLWAVVCVRTVDGELRISPRLYFCTLRALHGLHSE